MQLPVQTVGKYEVICAKLIDDLCIPFVPAFSKTSGHCFVIYFCEMPGVYIRCCRNAFTNWVSTRGQREG